MSHHSILINSGPIFFTVKSLKLLIKLVMANNLMKSALKMVLPHWHICLIHKFKHTHTLLQWKTHMINATDCLQVSWESCPRISPTYSPEAQNQTLCSHLCTIKWMEGYKLWLKLSITIIVFGFFFNNVNLICIVLKVDF